MGTKNKAASSATDKGKSKSVAKKKDEVDVGIESLETNMSKDKLSKAKEERVMFASRRVWPD